VTAGAMSMQLSERRREYPPFRYDGNGTKARIGKITISSSIVMESEMTAMAARGVAFQTDFSILLLQCLAGCVVVLRTSTLL